MKHLILALAMLIVGKAEAASLNLGFNTSIGLDMDSAVSGCIQRAVYNGQWKGGPCANVLSVKHNDVRYVRIGGGIMYNAEQGNAGYTVLAGTDFGTMGSAIPFTLGWLGSRVNSEMLADLAGITPPKFLSYIGSVTTLYYSASIVPVHTADVFGHIEHGPVGKVDIPFEDIQAVMSWVLSTLRKGI